MQTPDAQRCSKFLFTASKISICGPYVYFSKVVFEEDVGEKIESKEKYKQI